MRNTRGMPVKSREAEPKQGKGKSHFKDEQAEPVKEGGSGDKESTPMENPRAVSQVEMIRAHHDRLKVIEDHLGLSKKEDEMEDEDQKNEKGKMEAGKVTEKATRRRH